MIKAGDMFKNIENGKMFKVKSTDSRIIILDNKGRIPFDVVSIQTAWNPRSCLL